MPAMAPPERPPCELLCFAPVTEGPLPAATAAAVVDVAAVAVALGPPAANAVLVTCKLVSTAAVPRSRALSPRTKKRGGVLEAWVEATPVVLEAAVVVPAAPPAANAVLVTAVVLTASVVATFAATDELAIADVDAVLLTTAALVVAALPSANRKRQR